MVYESVYESEPHCTVFVLLLPTLRDDGGVVSPSHRTPGAVLHLMHRHWREELPVEILCSRVALWLLLLFFFFKYSLSFISYFLLRRVFFSVNVKFYNSKSKHDKMTANAYRQRRLWSVYICCFSICMFVCMCMYIYIHINTKSYTYLSIYLHLLSYVQNAPQVFISGAVGFNRKLSIFLLKQEEKNAREKNSNNLISFFFLTF